MKQRLLYLLTALVLCGGSAFAAPGDTTWVQANNVNLDYYNNFDTAVSFPSGTVSYRKVYMIFTLGAYNCPAGTQYCHQWDYTVQNYLMTPAGDTLELGRFITPYGNSGVPRFPSGWTYRYIFDVTDYYPLLKNNARMRIHYSGYSGGFTGNIKFAFVEGTPERNVMGVAKLWDASYDYGKAADPIDNHVTAKTLTAPAGTQAAEMKMNITGHGSDATDQCCEFSSHSYSVKVNGNTVDSKTIWRDDCGLNELYPQGGTWIYDRANWCPGALVNTVSHKLTGVTAGTPYTTDVDFSAYTNTPSGSNGGYGSYTIQANVIYYGALNRTLNAAIQDIIAPTNFEGYFRENPASDHPIIRIRNTGSTAISSVSLQYGVKDSVLTQYTWTGNLPSMKDTTIQLPAAPAIRNLSLNGASGQYNFIARITGVNGSADNDHTDDTLRSTFVVAPNWPNMLDVVMKTNNEGVTNLGVAPSETSWKILDMNNNVVASRTNNALKTLYDDTVVIGTAGFYKLVIEDLGCDGLHWWPYDGNNNVGAGYFRILDENGSALAMNGYTTSGTYGNDFGCGFTQYFSVKGWATGVHDPARGRVTMSAFPNPATNTLSVAIGGLSNASGNLVLIDMTGRTVATQKYTSGTAAMDVRMIPNGIYQLIYEGGEGAAGTRLNKRVMIKN